MVEYKVVIYQKGFWGSLFLGESKVDPIKVTNFLNEHAKEGWKVKTMEKEYRRMFLFWKREALVFILERDT